MRVVLFTHPAYLGSESMLRFARMIHVGLEARGHTVELWSPAPFLHRLPAPVIQRKWLGYFDQYALFPLRARGRLNGLANDTLFVFADQALGPWVPLVADRPHVIHAHDFIALRAALGEFKQNPISWTGRKYQAMVRRGFGKGRYFISVSGNTRADLHRFLPRPPRVSEVVFNGLNFPFHPMSPAQCAAALSGVDVGASEGGHLLHVGGNQWYKNRVGVLEIYDAYVRQAAVPLPLWMIGAPPTKALRDAARRIAHGGTIMFLTGLTGQQLCAAYSSAHLLLFPSLAEGFGWPVSEAMACGCPVLTTNQAPMTEVGGEAAYYMPLRPNGAPGGWARNGAERIIEILASSAEVRQDQRRIGLARCEMFDADRTLDEYERVYLRVLEGAPG
jgi:glycosyltransferase involved in cell wall biosynthesis